MSDPRTPEEFAAFVAAASSDLTCCIDGDPIVVSLCGAVVATATSEAMHGGGVMWIVKNGPVEMWSNCVSLTQIMGRVVHGSRYSAWFSNWYAAGMPKTPGAVTEYAPAPPGRLHKDAVGLA